MLFGTGEPVCVRVGALPRVTEFRETHGGAPYSRVVVSQVSVWLGMELGLQCVVRIWGSV